MNITHFSFKTAKFSIQKFRKKNFRQIFELKNKVIIEYKLNINFREKMIFRSNWAKRNESVYMSRTGRSWFNTNSLFIRKLIFDHLL